jgi:peptidoglycan/xylan/chitin deacetylase (PgdA/CDA1 family)
MPLRALEPIPDKTVVLTFDDSPKSHREFVAPLLKEHGFGATFFISARWMDDTANFMSWPEIAELHQMGFEIGNHSWSHLDFGSPVNAARLAGQLALVENELERVGVPRPVSFAWCGNSFGPEAMAKLSAGGYRYARRGMQPEVPYGLALPGPLYDSKAHHPLLVPSAGDAYPNWTMESFRAAVDRARDGKIAVVQFHGVPDTAHPWVSTPPSAFRAYMQYLKDEGFNVIALRDLDRYVDPEAEVQDAMTAVHYGPKSMELPAELMTSRVDSSYWLENMMRWHNYSAEESAEVLGWPAAQVAAWAAQAGSTAPHRGLAPYPGGRHPRIGFLEGMIEPIRGTKASVFSPWGDGGYAVIDLPEAVFSNTGLLFLAHTHVPTVWDTQHVQLDNRDWARAEDGALSNAWPLPNGVKIGAEAHPAENGADFRLWLENGTAETLTGLRTQVCVMLKGLPGFEAQDLDNKEFSERAATATSSDGTRKVTVEFTHCGRAWGNPLCPCIHADPVFPDCPPGERTEVSGTLRFSKR